MDSYLSLEMAFLKFVFKHAFVLMENWGWWCIDETVKGGARILKCAVPSSCTRWKWSKGRQRWRGGEGAMVRQTAGGWRKAPQGGGFPPPDKWREGGGGAPHTTSHCGSESWAKGYQEWNAGIDSRHVWPGLLHATVKEMCPGSELCCDHGLRFRLCQDWPASGELLGGQLG